MAGQEISDTGEEEAFPTSASLTRQGGRELVYKRQEKAQRKGPELAGW